MEFGSSVRVMMSPKCGIHCGLHKMMIRIVHHESHPLLQYILKFYLNRSPSHHTIDHTAIIRWVKRAFMFLTNAPVSVIENILMHTTYVSNRLNNKPNNRAFMSPTCFRWVGCVQPWAKPFKIDVIFSVSTMIFSNFTSIKIVLI